MKVVPQLLYSVNFSQYRRGRLHNLAALEYTVEAVVTSLDLREGEFM